MTEQETDAVVHVLIGYYSYEEHWPVRVYRDPELAERDCEQLENALDDHARIDDDATPGWWQGYETNEAHKGADGFYVKEVQMHDE